MSFVLVCWLECRNTRNAVFSLVPGAGNRSVLVCCLFCFVEEVPHVSLPLPSGCFTAQQKSNDRCALSFRFSLLRYWSLLHWFGKRGCATVHRMCSFRSSRSSAVQESLQHARERARAHVCCFFYHFPAFCIHLVVLYLLKSNSFMLHLALLLLLPGRTRNAPTSPQILLGAPSIVAQVRFFRIPFATCSVTFGWRGNLP